jgi:C4-dicarboxylate transporter DctM subunit
MNIFLQSFIILGILISGMMVGIPIAFSIGLTSVVGIVLFLNPAALASIANIAWATSSNFVMASIPMFMFMSEIIMYTGIGEDMFKALEKWFGRLPGGLVIGGTVSSAIFGAVSGTAIGVASIVGGIAIPEMKKANYSNKIACGSIAAASTLGMLIPPSQPMISYGILTGTSVGHLFIAGIIPGIVLCSMYCLYIIFRSRKEPVGFTQYGWGEKFKALAKVLPVVCLIIMVIGSIYGGFATTSEASGVGAIGAVIIAIAMRRLKPRDLFNALRNAARTCGAMTIMMLNARVFSYLLTALRLPMMVSNWMVSLGLSKWVVFIVIQIIFVFLGMFFDAGSIFLLTMPLLFPIAVSAGFDPIWFCIVCTVNMCIAVITPPVGLATYVVKGIYPEASIGEIVGGAMPFLVIDVLMILLLCVFPGMTSILL